MKTVTVIGRLLDEQGAPLRGAMVVNHAGRTVTEADGFFAVEMSARNPVLRMEMDGSQRCEITIDAEPALLQRDIMLLGDLPCQKSDTTLSSLRYE